MPLKRISSQVNYKQILNELISAIDDVDDPDVKNTLFSLQKKLKKAFDKIQFNAERAVKDKKMVSSLLQKTTDDLKSSLAAEKNFLASMSHEIRTPLNAIVGFIELLSKTSLNTTQREFISNISISSEHLLSLINDVLDVSKIEAGQMELNISEVDLEIILMDAVMLTSSRVGKDVALQVDIPDLDYMVFVDVLRMKQVFVNLLGNASKFTSKGFIRLSLLEVANRSEGKVWMRFCVEDTGIGISQEKQGELFKAFSQAHSNQQGGTGLGLYLSKSIISVMGGNIYVESVEGQGSQFFVEFVVTSGKKRSEQYDFKQRKVLLIESEEHFSEQLGTKLLQSNCQLNQMANQSTLHDVSSEIIKNPHDILILDLDAFGKPVLPLLELVSELYPQMLIIATIMHDQILGLSENLITLKKPFPFHLLAKFITEHEEKKQTSHHKDFSDLSVLVVEDVKMNVLLVKAMLNKYFNLTFDHAENGEIAVEKVKSRNYDIVFMDIQMPIMNGIEATKAIREFDQKTQIYAMTANALAEDNEMSIRSGMNGFITKPISKQDIQQALESVIELL